MRIAVATVFPKIYEQFFQISLMGRAVKNSLIFPDIISLIDLCDRKERVDTPIAGHGAGMLIGAPLVERAYTKATATMEKPPFTIFFSPHGTLLDQKLLKKIYQQIIEKGSLLLFAGRYEGFDARAEEQYADEIISIGHYVTAGGDLPAMVFLEALLRLHPGFVGNSQSVEEDSFTGSLVDAPHFTHPPLWQNRAIPDVLRSGNHGKVTQWRQEQALERTAARHFSWWRHQDHSLEERLALHAYIPPHYCALMHNDVVLPGGAVGESSVTSIDIHDIARSSTTYGIKQFFIITRIPAQQILVKRFLQFWHEGEGVSCNPSRATSLKNVTVTTELLEVIDEIEKREGIAPLLIITSAHRPLINPMITFHDQEMVWREKKPLLFLFGTAQGLSPLIVSTMKERGIMMQQLVPLEGMSSFNALSVRSAAAIIFDRWLGINKKH